MRTSLLHLRIFRVLPEITKTIQLQVNFGSDTVVEPMFRASLKYCATILEVSI
jgi:hypothetical protein